MRKYKTKTLIDGFKILPELTGKEIIALNAKLVGDEKIEVTVKDTGDRFYIDPKQTQPVHKLQFSDKYKRGEKYWIYYYVAESCPKEKTLFD